MPVPTAVPPRRYTPLEHILHSLKIVCEHARVAGPLLPERQRRGVLHVSPADLDDVLPLLGSGCDGVVQTLHRRYQTLVHIHCRRYAHRSGERIV